MATRVHTVEEIKPFGDRAHIIQWTGLLNGDDGDLMEMPGSLIRGVQFTGTFGSGGTIVLEGSNDGTNFVTLTDPQGNAISKTSAAIEAIQELTRYIRPRVTAGDETTALVATVIVRRMA